MARYFFEVRDGELVTPDDQGLDLADLDAAKRAAIAALADLARDELPGGERREFAIQVRDQSGIRVVTAKLSVSLE